MEREQSESIGTSVSLEPDASEPIVRRSLHDELLARLRDLIIDGDLVPGEKVPEKDLCARFSVSRTPLREALKVLANEGLVTLMPNRGATVTALTIEDLEETFPVMGALEALAGEMAALRITDGEIDAIRNLHEAMVAHYHRRELAPYFKLNQKIHEAILEAAGNQTLAGLHRSLASRVRRARFVANMSAERWAKAVAEHEEILVALQARAPEGLGLILKRHLANTFETVKETLISDESA